LIAAVAAGMIGSNGTEARWENAEDLERMSRACAAVRRQFADALHRIALDLRAAVCGEQMANGSAWMVCTT
jgi:hypothetical protein